MISTGLCIVSAAAIVLAVYIIRRAGLSNKAPVIEVPSHAIIAAMILRAAIRKNSRRTKC